MSTRWAVVGILVLAAVTRLHLIDAPLVDHMFVKQVFVANKARAIAGHPFDPLRNDFDFLDESGGRMHLTEEIPLYPTLLAAGYRLVGEQDWLGRAFAVAATLVALLAFFDLTRREFDDSLALVATLLLAASPLLVYFGRCVLPDPAMLAGMLVAACCYRRYLDGGGWGWAAGAACAGLAAAAFKYYGLMVLLPMADMAWRRHGWRGLFRLDLLLPAAVMTVPVAAWMTGAFNRTPNPAQTHAYFSFQDPGVLAIPDLYVRFLDRFLYKDCGPIAMLLIGLGAMAAVRHRLPVRPLLSWTVMGVSFYFLLGPKLLYHDYYELMMLPAAATWAAIGWTAIRGSDPGGPAWRRWWAVGVLLTAVVVHSPLVVSGKFTPEPGQLALAERLREITPPGGKVLVLGPDWTSAVIHYCGREGWSLVASGQDPDLRQRLMRYRDLGATSVAVYFQSSSTAVQREEFLPLIRSLRVLDHQSGFSGRKGTGEFYILALPPRPASRSPRHPVPPASPPP